jgi:NOL1/NOP2/fmu family ribosome biogenesis protein
MNLLKKEGYFQYIVSNKWMRANYGQPLREWIQQYQIKSIVDFGDLPVFEEATTYPCLLQLSKEYSEKPFQAAEIDDLEFENLHRHLNGTSFKVDQSKLLDEGWSLITKEAQALLYKIKEKGQPLGIYVNGEIYRGILTGLNEAFIIDEDTKEDLINTDSSSKELIKPFLKGRDINRYEPPNSDEYLILIPHGWTKSNTDEDDKWPWFKSEYPAIANHLNKFKKKAKKRYDQGEYWWELRACSYYEEFEKPKIILPDISKRGQFTLDPSGEYYMVNTAYMICSKEKYLLGILCSDLIDFFYRNISSKYRGDYLRFIFQYLEQIPIIEPEKKEKKKIESLVDQILAAKQDNSDADTSEQEAAIDQLVYELYGLSEEEIGIVERSVG